MDPSKPSLAPGLDKKASAEDKANAVRSMFDKIVGSYDLLNHVMSAWQDVLWRKWTAERLPENCSTVLDVACGTGDLAIEILRQQPQSTVTGLDFSPEMLRYFEGKAVSKGLQNRLTFTEGDAMNLPFEDNTFDAATIAFGLRNVTDRLAAIKEMTRVVKPGGKILTLEMTFPDNMGLRQFFFWYLNNAIPFVGGLISGDRQAYAYLPESIQNFLSPDELMVLFRKAGLTRRIAWSMTFGITYLHEGTVV